MINTIKRIIADFNQTPLPTLIERNARAPLNINKIITITGPRRAGKTYFFYQIIQELLKKGIKKDHILYLNFEDERLNITDNYDLIFDAWQELYPQNNISEAWLFFDEIQELPNWEKFIRRVYDTKTRNIFLTGSNARVLSREIATSLRGRSFTLEIMPLSFSEYLDFKNIDYSDIFSTKNRAQIENAFDDYLFFGGYPEIVSFDNRIKSKVLQEYLNVTIYQKA